VSVLGLARRPPAVGLGLVLALAAALRFYRLDFDLPEVTYLDGFKFVGEATRMVSGAFARAPENERYFPRSVETYEAFMPRLAEQAEVVHARLGWAEGRIGPDIRIWEMKAR
jgi:hypothetical protein